MQDYLTSGDGFCGYEKIVTDDKSELFNYLVLVGSYINTEDKELTKEGKKDLPKFFTCVFGYHKEYSINVLGWRNKNKGKLEQSYKNITKSIGKNS